MEKLLVECTLTKEESTTIRNIAFLIARGNHKKEWYLETIKGCIRPDRLEHALGYLNFLTFDSDLIFNRRPYDRYIRRLKKRDKNQKQN